MEANIRDRILQLNPWFVSPEVFPAFVRSRLPERYIPRRLSWDPDLLPRRALLLVGPRQVGKTTLLWSRLQDRRPEELLYLSGEEPLVRSWTRSAVGFQTDLRTSFPGVRTVFMDEAQHLDEAGFFVKGLIDAREGLEVLVTGSSAFDLQSRTRESLAGRAVRRRLLPFSLGEVMACETNPIPAVWREWAEQALARQMIFGAYPETWSHPKPAQLLSDIVDALVLRDASDRFHLQHPDAFRRLLQLLALQVGQMVNLAELAGRLGIASSTVREYISILEESWIVGLVPSFSGGKRREITSAVRVHFHDMGIRNQLLGSFEEDLGRRADRGALAEGWAFGEISKVIQADWQLRYWRAKGGAEMDFVVVRGEQVIGVEIKAGGASHLTRSSRSFIEAYQPALVILAGAMDERKEDQIGRTRVIRCPLYELGDVISEGMGTRG